MEKAGILVPGGVEAGRSVWAYSIAAALALALALMTELNIDYLSCCLKTFAIVSMM